MIGDVTDLGPESWTVSRGGHEVILRVFPEMVVARRLPRKEDGADQDAALARIAALLAQETARVGKRVMTWLRPRAAAWNRALEGAGFVEVKRKVFVERDLTGDLPEPGPFTWRPLSETGETEFVRVMTLASEGDPFEDENARDPVREWRDLMEHAASAGGPGHWRIAVLEGEPVGVVLPTLWPDDKAEGTLSYIGLLPAWRGRGLGAQLHASGLHFLAAAGARNYVGSTEVRNAAMLRVFATNDCPVTGTQVFLAPPPPAAPTG